MIKDLLKARNRKTGLLLPEFEEFMVNLNKEPDRRKTGVFHPSEVSGGRFCAREWCFVESDPLLRVKKKEISPGLRLRFLIGNVAHDAMQDLLGDSEHLWGSWVCNNEQDRCVEHGFKPNFLCEHMQDGRDPTWTYRELICNDDDLLIYGHTDGIAIIGQSKYIFEFKTISSSGFRTLIAPIDAHVEQAYLYLHCQKKKQASNAAVIQRKMVEARSNGDLALYERLNEQLQIERMPFDGVIVWYLNKEEQALDIMGCIKEYIIRNDSKAEEYIKQVEAETEPARKWMLSGKQESLFPERKLCSNKTEGRKRRCCAVDECFGAE